MEGSLAAARLGDRPEVVEEMILTVLARSLHGEATFSPQVGSSVLLCVSR